MERPARANRDIDRAERGRCFDTHEQSFHWMDIEDKVDIRLTHRIAILRVNVYRMESQSRCNIFTQVNVLLHFPTYCLVSNIKLYTQSARYEGVICIF